MAASASTRTPTWPAGPSMRWGSPPSPCWPGAAGWTGVSWPAWAWRGGMAALKKAAQVALRDVTGTSTQVTGNWVSAGRAQLRLGHDLLWYPYARPEDEWEPAGSPQPDPARAAEIL